MTRYMINAIASAMVEVIGTDEFKSWYLGLDGPKPPLFGSRSNAWNAMA